MELRSHLHQVETETMKSM